MGPLLAGVAVILLFSIAWPLPIREANGFLCLGVALGGFVAGSLEAESDGDRLESVSGLKLGAQAGLLAALVVIVVDLLVAYTPGTGDRAGFDYLDPIPRYIYAAIYGIWDGLLDLTERGGSAEGLAWPGRIARYVILLGSTILFAAFGGGVAASTYATQPSLAEERATRPQAPARPAYMGGPDQAIQVQKPQEAEIYEPDEQEQARPAAATGTYGAGGSQTAYFLSQPRFAEGQERSSGRRPGSEMSVEPPERARTASPETQAEEK